MARQGRPERNRTARSFRQLRRFHRVINSDKVIGTHRYPLILPQRLLPRCGFLSGVFLLAEWSILLSLAGMPVVIPSQYIERGFEGPSHGNTNAAERSYSAQAALCCGSATAPPFEQLVLFVQAET